MTKDARTLASQQYSTCTCTSSFTFVSWYVECKVQDIDMLGQRLPALHPMTNQQSDLVSIVHLQLQLQPLLQLEPQRRLGHMVMTISITAMHTRMRTRTRTRTPPHSSHDGLRNSCRLENNAVVVDSTASPEVLRDHILKQILSYLEYCLLRLKSLLVELNGHLQLCMRYETHTKQYERNSGNG